METTPKLMQQTPVLLFYMFLICVKAHKCLYSGYGQSVFYVDVLKKNDVRSDKVIEENTER
jgi:hypothetical protein